MQPSTASLFSGHSREIGSKSPVGLCDEASACEGTSIAATSAAAMNSFFIGWILSVAFVVNGRSESTAARGHRPTQMGRMAPMPRKAPPIGLSTEPFPKE